MPLIGEGNYGCVFRPFVKCEKKKIKKAVGKVFVNPKEYESEHRIQDDIVSKIDPDAQFTLPLLGDCKIQSFKPSDRASECSLIDSKILPNLHQLIYKDGGQNLKDVLLSKGSVKKFKMIFSKMRPILAGLVKMEIYGYVHQDIKPQNIMYDGKKIHLIDFGIMAKSSDIFGAENMYILKYDYPYYPPEYKVYAFKTSHWPTFVSKVHDNFKFYFNIGGQNYTNMLSIIQNEIGIDVKTELKNSFTKKRKQLLQSNKAFAKVDIYSLGIVFLQLFIWSGLHEKVFVKKSKNKLLKEKLILLIRAMIHFDMDSRGNAQYILSCYDNMFSLLY